MSQKNFVLSALLDLYSPLLNENHRLAVEYYYNDDLSLSEIGEIMGITRQGARSLIKAGEKKLFEFDASLGLSEKLSQIETLCNEISSCADSKEKVLLNIEKIRNIL